MADSPATGNVDRSLSQSVVDSSATEANTSKTEEKTTSAMTSADTTGESNKSVWGNKEGGDSDAKENGGEASRSGDTVGGLTVEELTGGIVGGDGQELICELQEGLKEGANTSGNESDVRSRSVSPTKLDKKTTVKKHSFKPVSVNKLFMKEAVAPSSPAGAGGSSLSGTPLSSSLLSKGSRINHLPAAFTAACPCRMSPLTCPCIHSKFHKSSFVFFIYSSDSSSCAFQAQARAVWRVAASF